LREISSFKVEDKRTGQVVAHPILCTADNTRYYIQGLVGQSGTSHEMKNKLEGLRQEWLRKSRLNPTLRVGLISHHGGIMPGPTELTDIFGPKAKRR
jgi:hypothetical protein